MNKRLYLYPFLGLVLLYVVIVLCSPSDPAVLEKYSLTSATARLLGLSVVVPLVAIWMTAFYGFSKLKQYAAAVTGSPEAPALQTLATGLLVLTMSLPLAASASAALNYAAQRNPELISEATIIRNYITVAAALVAFYFIGKGAEALAKSVKRKTMSFDNQLWAVGFIIISSVFSWLVISHSGGTQDSIYHLPGWLVVLTIVIPYLYIWYRGMLAAYCIYFYQKNVKGELYRRALGFFSAGIAMVIIAMMTIQLLTVFTERLNRLHLTPLLLILYLLIIIYAVGYIFIARGANKLKTFEEV